MQTQPWTVQSVEVIPPFTYCIYDNMNIYIQYKDAFGHNSSFESKPFSDVGWDLLSLDDVFTRV